MFDISVVVPVFNKENFIEACIKSILDQKTQKKIEVICVDDGSTDNSRTIVEQIAGEHNNVTILQHLKENGGVSSARNIGLSKATGRYVLFLDADDYLSENTIEDIVNFFDKNNSLVDLVTYNIFYDNGQKLIKGKRGIGKTKDTVIDLVSEPDFSQTTMNVCVKNGLGVTFDESLRIGEDQLFNTNIAVKKAKIGWCNTAQYVYRRTASSTTIINHPYYSKKEIAHLFNELIELSKFSEAASDYCKSLILYNLSWRISGDFLFDYNETNGKQQIDGELLEILNQIDNRLIINNKWLTREHKQYLIFSKTRNQAFPIVENDGLYLCDSIHGELLCEKEITIVMQRERLHNKLYKLCGFLKSDCLNYIDKPKLFLRHNEVEHEVDLYDSANSYFGSAIKTNQYYGFEIQIPLEEENYIEFFAVVNGKRINTNFWFRAGGGFISDSKIFKYEKEGFNLELKSRKIYIARSQDNAVIMRVNEKDYGRRLIRAVARFLQDRTKIWLYVDAKGYLDNSFVQFTHDIKKIDGIFKFYIYSGSVKEVSKHLPFFRRFQLVKKNSTLHKVLFLGARKVFTSFFESSMFVPFGPALKYYSDLLNCECIYLQHGVMHAKLVQMYSKDRSSFIDRVVVSTEFEKEVAIRDLNYQSEDVLPYGMPRYSTFKVKGDKGKKIIFAPSWRKYLVQHLGPDNWHAKEGRVAAEFIGNINSLINNDKLLNDLKKHDYVLDVKLHRNFSCYSDQIKANSDRVRIVDSADPNEYEIAISDISSYIFDFMYYGTKIIKFIPDLEQFKAGLHSYREFNYDFYSIGEVTTNVDETVERVHQFLEGSLTANYDRDEVFLSNISNACENIYNAEKQK